MVSCCRKFKETGSVVAQYSQPYKFGWRSCILQRVLWWLYEHVPINVLLLFFLRFQIHYWRRWNIVQLHAHDPNHCNWYTFLQLLIPLTLADLTCITLFFKNITCVAKITQFFFRRIPDLIEIICVYSSTDMSKGDVSHISSWPTKKKNSKLLQIDASYFRILHLHFILTGHCKILRWKYCIDVQ
jgi:hypothetical protein